MVFWEKLTPSHLLTFRDPLGSILCFLMSNALALALFSHVAILNLSSPQCSGYTQLVKCAGSILQQNETLDVSFISNWYLSTFSSNHFLILVGWPATWHTPQILDKFLDSQRPRSIQDYCHRLTVRVITLLLNLSYTLFHQSPLWLCGGGNCFMITLSHQPSFIYPHCQRIIQGHMCSILIAGNFPGESGRVTRLWHSALSLSRVGWRSYGCSGGMFFLFSHVICYSFNVYLDQYW